jgi:hypothetical protein
MTARCKATDQSYPSSHGRPSVSVAGFLQVGILCQLTSPPLRQDTPPSMRDQKQIGKAGIGRPNLALLALSACDFRPQLPLVS